MTKEIDYNKQLLEFQQQINPKPPKEERDKKIAELRAKQGKRN